MKRGLADGDFMMFDNHAPEKHEHEQAGTDPNAVKAMEDVGEKSVERDLRRVEERVSRTETELGKKIRELGESLDRVKNSLASTGFTHRVKKLVDRVAETDESPPEDILLKALSFYSRALQAERAGQRIAVLDPDDTIVAEIGGFTSPLSLPALTP